MRCLRFYTIFSAAVLLASMLSQGASLPTTVSLADIEMDNAEDTGMVESTVREVRAVAPEHIKDAAAQGTKVDTYVKSYGDDDGTELGYHKQTSDEGGDGYKHFDSFHKKNGNKYGFEEHSAYGKLQDDKANAEQKGEKESLLEDIEDVKETNENTKKVEQTPRAARQTYEVVEDIEEDGGNAALYVDGESENLEDDSAQYTDGGESEHYVDAEHYVEGGDDGNDEETSHYTAAEDADDAEINEGSDGESEHLTAAEYDDDGDY